MVNAFIRSMIGSWGNVILDFYLANGFWINGLLLLYALLVVFSRRNFDNSLQLLLFSLQKEFGEQFAKKGPGSLMEILKKAAIPWAAALTKSPLPFITPPGSFRLYPKNAQTFQKFITLEKLVDLLQQK
jgi:hypothetical protein